jgi:alkylation response protein AidB-like acyl-CoA dehydrogenase
MVISKIGVPASNLIGAEGQGFKIAMAGLDGGRSTSAPARSAFCSIAIVYEGAQNSASGTDFSARSASPTLRHRDRASAAISSGHRGGRG